MPRLHASLVALLVLIACSVGRPLYTPDPGHDAATQPEVGGKGFVSSRVDGVAPPMSLTASDGSGLRLLSLHAEATVDDPLATTEMELRFLNPKPEIIEGKFELVLPPGASITRFAMMVGGAWQEAEIVERQKGRVVYESFQHQQRDPALLEQETGNRFGVRVFPIPASGEAQLRVSYVQTFDEPTLPYRLALRGLPLVGEIDARIGVRQPDSGEIVWAERHLEQQRPHEDFVVARDAPRQLAWRSGNHVIARIEVPTGDREAKRPASFAILFDTSASRAIEFGSKVDQLRDVVEQLGRHVGPATKLVVLPFDQTVGAPAYVGPLSGFADSEAYSAILRRQALGASNLERALLVAAKQRAERVVVITDGMITAGKRDPAALREALRSLADAGTRRLDVVAGRDRRDDAVLHTLVTGDLPQSGVVIDAGRTPEDVAFRLVRPTAPDTAVRIAGATRVWPTLLRGVQAGDAVLVHAEVDRRGKALEVTLEAAGAEPVQQRVDVVRSTAPGFTQAWIRADVGQRLAELAATGDPRNPMLRKRLAELSVEHRILNELTAFIVLETEEDYARFGIERTDHGDGKEERAALPDDGEEEERVAPPDDELIEEDKPAPPHAMESDAMTRRPTSEVYEFDEVDASGHLDRDDAPLLRSRSATGIRRERNRRRELRTESVYRERPEAPPKPAKVVLRSVRVRGGGDEEARSMAERSRVDVEHCWFSAGASRRGSLTVELHIAASGAVSRVDLVRNGRFAPRELRQCLDQALRSRRFSTAGADGRRVRYTFAFRAGAVFGSKREPTNAVVDQLTDPDRFRTDEATYSGTFADVKRRLRLGELEQAWRIAWAWRRSAPDDLLALVAVGEVAHAQGRDELAARAFGSIAELYPSNAPMLRFAAARLEALGQDALPLAIDALEEAQRQRPDHPSSHRALAWALVERGRLEDGFDALARGFNNAYPDERFASAVAELGEELRIVGAAWLRAEPSKRKTIEARLADLGLTLADEPSLRFVLSWETDTNDVDLHVQDGRGSRAWYGNPELASGGTLLADVTNGYGPESFVIDGDPGAYPYYVAVHYYANGPMGYGMGHVQAIHHDGRGKLDIETIPFVAMKQDAKLLLGAIHPE